MSCYYINLKHKESGKEHEISAIDGYFGGFGGRVYGYKLPNGLVVTSDQLEKLYNPRESV